MGECGRNSVLCLFMQQSESIQVHLCNPYFIQIFIQDMRHPEDPVSNPHYCHQYWSVCTQSTGDVGKFSSTVQQIDSGFPINRNPLV